LTKAEFKKKIQIITAICIVIFLALVIIFTGQIISIIALNNKKEALQAAIYKQEKDRIVVEQELEYRESTNFVEQYAREVLGLVKADEEIYIVE